MPAVDYVSYLFIRRQVAALSSIILGTFNMLIQSKGAFWYALDLMILPGALLTEDEASRISGKGLGCRLGGFSAFIFVFPLPNVQYDNQRSHDVPFRCPSRMRVSRLKSRAAY
jgi:hypothetical protein